MLFHWVLMIHRIRVDVPNPLTYDLGWLVASGVTSAPGNTTVVLFRTGADPARSLAAIAEISRNVVWASPAGNMLAFEPAPATAPSSKPGTSIATAPSWSETPQPSVPA